LDILCIPKIFPHDEHPNNSCIAGGTEDDELDNDVDKDDDDDEIEDEDEDEDVVDDIDVDDVDIDDVDDVAEYGN
jgi:hypothetical protein